MKTLIAYGIARRIGLPILVEEKRGDPHWDGSILRVGPSWDGESEVLHEVAHFLLATKYKEVERDNWGLDNSDKLPRSWEHYLGEKIAAARETEADWLEGILRKVVDAALRESAAMVQP